MTMPATRSFDRRGALRGAALALAAGQVGLPGAVHAGGGDDRARARAQSPSPTRGGNTVTTPAAPPQATATDGAVRPFRIDVPQEALADLRRRVEAMRWPGKELVADRS
jgi:hypothetical protein